MRKLNKCLFLFSLVVFGFVKLTFAQKLVCKFCEQTKLEKITSDKKWKGESIQWFQVNTKEDTWKVQGKELICSGHPIGVIRV